MAVTTASGIEELRAKAGQHLGYSSWYEITQDKVNSFADATDDHQWIHVDVERAKTGPSAGRSSRAISPSRWSRGSCLR